MKHKHSRRQPAPTTLPKAPMAGVRVMCDSNDCPYLVVRPRRPEAVSRAMESGMDWACAFDIHGGADILGYLAADPGLDQPDHMVMLELAVGCRIIEADGTTVGEVRMRDHLITYQGPKAT